jgi:Ca2+-binding RTX toxin-like protein
MALALLDTGASRASTVEVNGDDDGIRYIAAPGEQNDVTFLAVEDTSAYLVTDPGAAIHAGKSCVPLDEHKVACIARSGAMYLRAQLGDGDDVLRSTSSAYVRADGGPGNDRLFGGTDRDKLAGGGGGDELHGGEGNDVLADGDGATPDADMLDGGTGGDQVNYVDRARAVTVDLADPGPDGAAGEGDTLIAIEKVHSGRGDDRILGTERSDFLRDEGGDNLISARGGHDRLRAPSGTVDCGAGYDIVRGVTRRTLLTPSCESLRRASGDGEFVVPAYPRAEAGGLALPMRCDGEIDGEPFYCRGVVTISTPTRALARVRLRRGTGRRVVRLELAPAVRRLLRDRAVTATIAIRGPGMPDMEWRITL